MHKSFVFVKNHSKLNYDNVRVNIPTDLNPRFFLKTFLDVNGHDCGLMGVTVGMVFIMVVVIDVIFMVVVVIVEGVFTVVGHHGGWSLLWLVVVVVGHCCGWLS